MPSDQAIRLTDQYGRGWFVWGLPECPDGVKITGIEWDKEHDLILTYSGSDALAESFFKGLGESSLTVLADNPDETRH